MSFTKTATADLLRRARWRLRALLGNDVYFGRQVRCDLVHVGDRFGTGYGVWAVCPEALSPQSVIYSFGIGEEISFDLDLIHRYGACVHAFDPTPASQHWLATQSLPEALVPHPYGLAAYDGTAPFYAPANPDWVSHSMLPAEHVQSEAIARPVHRLDTIMSMLGHDHIDLLKMDIEGAEYDVIADLAWNNLDVRQVLVEFHHRFENIPPARTAKAIQQLGAAGFRIAHVSARGEEYTFVR